MNEVREKDRMLFYEIMFQEEEAASTQTLRWECGLCVWEREKKKGHLAGGHRGRVVRHDVVKAVGPHHHVGPARPSAGL